MPDNATVSQILQLGVQTVFGTPVAATKRAQSFSIDIDPQINTDTFAPSGNIFPTSTSLIQEWSEGDVSGVLTYTEIVYLLSAIFGPATITTPGGGTLSRKWVWTIGANQLITPNYLTLEKGSSAYAIQVADAVLTGFNIGWNRTDKIEVGGSALAKRITKPFTLTTIGANPTVEVVRVMPPQIDVYFDVTFAGLGTTKLLRAFEAGISFDNLFGPIWPLNSALTGYDGIIPTMPDTESTMLLMADTAGLAFLDTVRAGTTGYLRIKGTGPIIETTIPYLFQVDVAVQIKDLDGFSDSDGIYAIPWTFQPISDGTNPPVTITVQNKQLAL
jgi:hypothetical protein